MKVHVDKLPDNQNKTATRSFTESQRSGVSAFEIVDNRPAAVTQRKLQGMADIYSTVQPFSSVVQRIVVSHDTKEILEAGNQVIGEVKDAIPRAANQVNRNMEGEEEKGAEKRERELSWLAFSRADSYASLLKAAMDVGPEDEPRKSFNNFFIEMGYYREDEVWGKLPTFTAQNAGDIFDLYFTAYAAEKMGGAVCAQYAALTALKLAELRPDLIVDIVSSKLSADFESVKKEEREEGEEALQTSDLDESEKAALSHAYVMARQEGKEFDADESVIIDPWPYSGEQKAYRKQERLGYFEDPTETMTFHGRKAKSNVTGKDLEKVPKYSEFVGCMDSIEQFKITEDDLPQEADIAHKEQWDVAKTSPGEEYTE